MGECIKDNMPRVLYKTEKEKRKSRLRSQEKYRKSEHGRAKRYKYNHSDKARLGRLKCIRNGGRFGKAKYDSVRRGKNWTLTKELYAQLINNTCFYCDGKLPETGVGLDRIDNLKGYKKDNVVPCCTACNSIRNNYITHTEMLEIKQFLIKCRIRREKHRN